MTSKKLNIDHIMRVLAASLTLTGTTAVSVELDFDIPRGFVVKIHQTEISVKNVVEDFEGISVDKIGRIRAAIVRDPDDAVTVAIPNNSVSHDVLDAHNVDVIITAGTAGDTAFYIGPPIKRNQYGPTGLTVITARNIRLNADAFGTDAADFTESEVEAIVIYELIRVTDTDILNLLDII